MSETKFNNPAYRIETERLVVRCYQPSDGKLLAESISESVDHLKTFMPWAHNEPEPIEEKEKRVIYFRGKFDMPIMEELFWRSILRRWVQQPDFMTIDPAQIGFKALLIASALFAVEHLQWLAGLVAGLAYGWLYIRTRNLWAPIVAHAVTNGLLGAYVVTTGEWSFW